MYLKIRHHSHYIMNRCRGHYQFCCLCKKLYVGTRIHLYKNTYPKISYHSALEPMIARNLLKNRCSNMRCAPITQPYKKPWGYYFWGTVIVKPKIIFFCYTHRLHTINHVRKLIFRRFLKTCQKSMFVSLSILVFWPVHRFSNTHHVTTHPQKYFLSDFPKL